MADWDDYREDKPVTYWASSPAFTKMIRQSSPELLVPESSEVYVGEGLPGWSPERETEGIPCDHARIIRRGLLVCPRCHTSGFESELAGQLRLSGIPPLDPPPRMPKIKPLTRKQRRAARTVVEV